MRSFSQFVFPRVIFPLLIVLTFGLISCSNDPLVVTGPKPPQGIIQFEGRSINLAPYLYDFPYDNYRWVASLDSNKLAYIKYEKGRGSLVEVSLSQEGQKPSVLRDGKVVSDIDFNKSKAFRFKYRKADGSIFFNADQNNDESFNIHRVISATKTTTKLTNVHYVSGYGFSPDEKLVAYVARSGDEGTQASLRVLNLETKEDKVIVKDTEDMRFWWTNVSWSPDGSGVVINGIMNKEPNPRNRANLLYISLTGDPTPVVLTNKDVNRFYPAVLETWVNDKELLFLSSENGYKNIYSINIETKKQTQLSKLKEDIQGAKLTTIKGKQVVVAVVSGYVKSKVYLFDLVHPEPMDVKFVKNGNLNLQDVKGNRILVQDYSAVNPMSITELRVVDEKIVPTVRASVSKNVLGKLVHCKLEQITYDTFDQIPLVLEGRELKGKLHANLFIPKKPLPKGKQLAAIQAFYGGQNRYERNDQILCEAGIYVLSPAPRGSSGLGKAFDQANDGDLGGKEIIDIIYAGKYMSKRFGIPENRIGIYGMSHGGYATIRTLTFPENFAGIDTRFNWGFGVSEAGFADVMGQYKDSNIKNWIAKELGDPEHPDADTRAKILKRFAERSPINFAENLRGNLLLIHGTNDQRVLFKESKLFHEMAVKSGKKDQVVLEAFEGQGHGIVGLKNIERKYRAWFSLFTKVLQN